MRPSLLMIGALAVALPIAVEVPDSSQRTPGETRVSAAGSLGYYALVERGCEGEVLSSTPVHFREGAASIEHRFPDADRGFPARVTVSLRGGALEQWTGAGGMGRTGYLNGAAALDWSKVGIGAGPFWSEHELVTGADSRARIPLSAHLRVGPWGRAYLLARLMESEPLYAGGGYLTAGVGFMATRRMDGFVGLSAPGPYDADGLALGWEYRLPSSTGVALRARLGSSANIGENAVSLGISQGFPSRP